MILVKPKHGFQCATTGNQKLTQALALQFCLRDECIHGNPIAFTTIEEIDAAVEAVTEPLPETVWQEFATLD